MRLSQRRNEVIVMSRIKQTLILALLVFIAIQFFRPARNVSGQVLQTDISKMYSIPNPVDTLLKNACYDCHSNNTIYPWYSNVQPVGWLLARDIENGRAKINFSEFGLNSSRKQISKLQEIENRIKDGTMPLGPYQFMHKKARLTKEEKEAIIGWIQKTQDSIAQER